MNIKKPVRFKNKTENHWQTGTCVGFVAGGSGGGIYLCRARDHKTGRLVGEKVRYDECENI